MLTIGRTVRHLPEKALKLKAFGGRALGVQKLRAYHIAVRADKPHLGVKL